MKTFDTIILLKIKALRDWSNSSLLDGRQKP